MSKKFAVDNTAHKIVPKVEAKKDESSLPVLEAVKHTGLGMLVGTAGSLTYFGTLDAKHWRATTNPQKVFAKFDICCADANVDEGKKKFKTFFLSTVSPAKVDGRFKVVVKADVKDEPAVPVVGQTV